MPRITLLTVVVACAMFGPAPAARTPADLPSRLSDQEFWQLTETLSEPNGAFQSDNLLSNELVFARLVPGLVARTKPGGVYLGVGPEQNFTYIAAVKPRIAFITDIRRGNLHLQLMYKALFELSADRAEFVSRLFTKPRPQGLTASSTATQLMDAYWEVFTADEKAFAANLEAVQNHLTKTHALPLSADDLAGVSAVYRAFWWYGPSMGYWATTSLAHPPMPAEIRPLGTFLADYRTLMSQTDDAGSGLSYLASEETFAVLKDLERRNLVVPVVGNFAGPKALRAVGAYVRDHGATVSAFYLSNVETYLRRDNIWNIFCANVATMPIDAGSVFIRPSAGSMVFTLLNADGTTTTSYRPAGGSGPLIGLVPIAGEVAGCGK